MRGELLKFRKWDTSRLGFSDLKAKDPSLSRSGQITGRKRRGIISKGNDLAVCSCRSTMTTPPTYTCKRASTPPPSTGALTDPIWEQASWTESFQDIRGPTGPDAPEGIVTRAKLLWDDTHLHIGAYLTEPHVWGTITTDNEVMFMDNNFEVFLDPDGDAKNYYELEINALGAVWQLSLDRPYSQGGEATSPHEVAGLVAKVHVDGTVNEPNDVDKGWSVTIRIPFAGLAQFGGGAPPKKGDVWRVNFSRVQWEHVVKDGEYVRVPPHGTDLPQGNDAWHPERNLVWAPTGVVNIHLPDCWGFVRFEE